MSSSGRAALCAVLVHAIVVTAGCGRIGYDRGDDALDADAARDDAGATDAATIPEDAASGTAFDGLQSCTTGSDCSSGSCWGRWCVAPCSAGCGVGFECLTLPSSSFAYCLPYCDRGAGCPSDAPCNGSLCEPTCGASGVCPGSTICMAGTCSGD